MTPPPPATTPPPPPAPPAPAPTTPAPTAPAPPEPTTLPAPDTPRPTAGRVTGITLVLAGMVSGQFGSALAALLLPRAGALGVVALRVTLAALLLLLVCRPRLRGHSRTDWSVAVAFGLALGGMNLLFYQAIDRIPLGPAVTLEVLGPLLLSVVMARRALSLLWAALALAGVGLLGGVGGGAVGGGDGLAFAGLDPAGVGFALAAGALWAAYIVLGARSGARFPGLDGLAVALAVATALTLPLGIGSAGTALLRPDVLCLGLAIAVLSSGLPYALELLALRRLPPATFAVLTPLAPALAALAGFLVLHQTLSPLQCAAIALVVAATTGASRTAHRPPRHTGRPS
ncbi:EamA family transporter [Streptomyces sp. NPDC090022]|uniref:EamA family transporter n=1 Tax=Streptomyces sp. NPDC090022 TaxID=3365920 RepID=UPI003805450E